MKAQKNNGSTEYSEIDSATIDMLEARAKPARRIPQTKVLPLAIINVTRQALWSNGRRSSSSKSIRKRKKKQKLKKLASVRKDSSAFRNIVKRVSFLGSVSTSNHLKYLSRELMKKIQMKKIEKKSKLAKIPLSQRKKKEKTLAELYPPLDLLRTTFPIVG